MDNKRAIYMYMKSEPNEHAKRIESGQPAQAVQTDLDRNLL